MGQILIHQLETYLIKTVHLLQLIRSTEQVEVNINTRLIIG